MFQNSYMHAPSIRWHTNRYQDVLSVSEVGMHSHWFAGPSEGTEVVNPGAMRLQLPCVSTHGMLSVQKRALDSCS